MKETSLCLLLMLTAAGCTTGGTAGSDGGGNTQDQAGPPRGSGALNITSFAYMAGGKPVKSSTATVSFTDPGQSIPCTLQTFGACQTTSCQVPPSSSDGGTTIFPDAGVLNITGGLKPISLTPRADGTYGAYGDTMNVLWNGGEMLSVAAAGSKVPAFSATVPAPVAATVSAPPAPGIGSVLMVNRSMDLVVKWTGGQTNSIQVTLSQPTVQNQIHLVTCYFPASDTMGTVPAAALSTLPSGLGNFITYSAGLKNLSAGNYDVHLSALTINVDSAGQPVSYGVMLQ